MIAQNSEVYNPPTYLFSLYTYMEKDLCRGLYTSLFCAIIPALFPYFLPFWYHYILLHFQMFFITCVNMLHYTSGRGLIAMCNLEVGLSTIGCHLNDSAGRQLTRLVGTRDGHYGFTL